MGVSACRRIGVCKALLILQGVLDRYRQSIGSERRSATAFPVGLVLVLGAFFLLAACSSTDSGKRDDPVFFGHAGGGTGGGDAVSGMSLHW
jgi:hypothetical protein